VTTKKREKNDEVALNSPSFWQSKMPRRNSRSDYVQDPKGSVLDNSSSVLEGDFLRGLSSTNDSRCQKSRSIFTRGNLNRQGAIRLGVRNSTPVLEIIQAPPQYIFDENLLLSFFNSRRPRHLCAFPSVSLDMGRSGCALLLLYGWTRRIKPL